MRRAAVLAVLLTLVAGGTALAVGPPSKVMGDFTYIRAWFEGNVPNTHTVSIDATMSPLKGGYSFASSDGRILTGPVTCMVVVGPDAWLAGPATGGTRPGMAMFFRIHDGGRPALDRVVAVVDLPDNAQRACQEQYEGYPVFALETGKVKVVHPGS